MDTLRRLLSRFPLAAPLVLAAAMLLRVAVPAGFMPAVGDDGRITVTICTGSGPIEATMAIPQGGGEPRGKHGMPAAADQHCPFAGLSTPSLAAADPILLALAVLFVMALALRPMRAIAPRAAPRLRPPLRGPPARI